MTSFESPNSSFSAKQNCHRYPLSIFNHCLCFLHWKNQRLSEITITHFFFFFLKIYLFLFERQMYREEDRQRGRCSVWWFTPQVAAMAGAELFQTQEPGTSSRSSTWVQGPKAGSSSTAFPGHKQGAWWEVELGLGLASVWDAGNAEH